jgi:hypothetical protein
VGDEGGLQVLRYSEKRERFQILDEEGVRKWVSVGDVTGKDRNILLAWLKENEVLFSEKMVAVKMDPQVQQLTTNALPVGVSMQRKREQSYLLSLKNLTDLSIEGLQVEYRYFISETNSSTEQVKTTKVGVDPGVTRSLAKGSIMTNPPQLGGMLMVDDMKKGQTLVFNTGAVELSGEYERAKVTDLFGSSYEDVALREERVIGVWVKLSGSKSDGTIVMQDVCVPRDLKQHVSWSDEVPMLTAVPVASDFDEPML